ncbi:unnamed protein product [Closterium sp. Naga37s-1]|nr:unnamed protein product [Closterium sp. Naga37s-1]
MNPQVVNWPGRERKEEVEDGWRCRIPPRNPLTLPPTTAQAAGQKLVVQAQERHPHSVPPAARHSTTFFPLAVRPPITSPIQERSSRRRWGDGGVRKGGDGDKRSRVRRRDEHCSGRERAWGAKRGLGVGAS